MPADKFYITTTLPYVNSDPHIGFALELIQADVIARFHRLIGDQVIFNTGTDEHGLKIYRKALENNISPQNYVDDYANRFKVLKESLHLTFDKFIRTTDPDHKKAAQEFWLLCYNNGDIYKSSYPVKYCVGCELEKTDSELENNRCPLHPNQDLEIFEEENYFFRFSKYQQPLLELYKENPTFVLPAGRQEEIINFVSQGLQDFSISRLKAKLPWGVPVPNDPDHVMYVWFDALINYISTLGWPNTNSSFSTYWPGTQIAGKDNLRQQSAMWQAMLLSAGLLPSRQILIHGFITANGQKMSKSLGNVVNPIDLVDTYGTDALRYYLLAEISPFQDGDFSMDKFITRYNADLANGIGNLASRLLTLATKLPSITLDQPQLNPQVEDLLNQYRYNDALQYIWDTMISDLDKQINQQQPWTQSGKQLETTMRPFLNQLNDIAFQLQPFLPQTSERISQAVSQIPVNTLPTLFPRIK